MDNLQRGEAGASSVEYALLVTGVAAVLIAAMIALGADVSGLIGSVCQGNDFC